MCVELNVDDVVSVLLQSCNSGLISLSSRCAAAMLSEKKMKKDREIVLELETQIKGRSSPVSYTHLTLPTILRV